MKRETIRCLKLGAADNANGINAKIGAVSIDVVAGDVRPANVTIYNALDHKWVARRRANAEDGDINFPALAIFQFGQLQVLDVEVKTVVRDALIKVAFAWLLKENNPLEVTSAGDYYNRALLQWIHWFMRNDQSSAFRTRNGIIIRTLEELNQDDVTESWEAADCVAQTIATFRVRETQP